MSLFLVSGKKKKTIVGGEIGRPELLGGRPWEQGFNKNLNRKKNCHAELGEEMHGELHDFKPRPLLYGHSGSVYVCLD